MFQNVLKTLLRNLKNNKFDVLKQYIFRGLLDQFYIIGMLTGECWLIRAGRLEWRTNDAQMENCRL